MYGAAVPGIHPDDGNLAALREYERQQDLADAKDEAIEARAKELAEDRDYLIDAFSSAIDRGELLEAAYNAVFDKDPLVVIAARTKLREQMDKELLRVADRQIDAEWGQ